MRPKKEDADKAGDVLVYVKANDTWAVVPWSLVTDACHWSSLPEAPKEPENPVLELLIAVENYRMPRGFSTESDYVAMKLAASRLRESGQFEGGT